MCDSATSPRQYTEAEKNERLQEYENSPETLTKLGGCCYKLIPADEWDRLWDTCDGNRRQVLKALNLKYDIVIRLQRFDNVIDFCVLIVDDPSRPDAPRLSTKELCERTSVQLCTCPNCPA